MSFLIHRFLIEKHRIYFGTSSVINPTKLRYQLNREFKKFLEHCLSSIKGLGIKSVLNPRPPEKKV